MSDPTPPLDEFLREYEADDNIWWVMECGHHQNLFEAAVERMEEAEERATKAEQLLARIVIPNDPEERPNA